MFRTIRLVFVISIVCCTIVLLGCAKKNPFGLEDVKGKISLNGSPVNLKIIFEPYDETQNLSNSSVFSAKDGTFELNMQNGLEAGKYRVRFSMRKAYWKDSLKPVPEGEDVHRDKVVLASALPEEFTTPKSQIEFEVVKGKMNVFEYDIVTDYTPSAKDIRAGYAKQ